MRKRRSEGAEAVARRNPRTVNLLVLQQLEAESFRGIGGFVEIIVDVVTVTVIFVSNVREIEFNASKIDAVSQRAIALLLIDAPIKSLVDGRVGQQHLAKTLYEGSPMLS